MSNNLAINPRNNPLTSEIPLILQGRVHAVHFAKVSRTANRTAQSHISIVVWGFESPICDLYASPLLGRCYAVSSDSTEPLLVYRATPTSPYQLLQVFANNYISYILQRFVLSSGQLK